MKAEQLLLWVLAFTLLQGCCSQQQEESYDRVTSLTLKRCNTSLLVSWTLTNPSGRQQNYRVTWNEAAEAADKMRTVLVPELTIGSDFPCFHKFIITVSPLNKTGLEIGRPASRSYTWQDIPIDLKFNNKGYDTRVDWSVKCRSKQLLKCTLTCQQDDRTSALQHTTTVSVPRGRTQLSAVCPNTVSWSRYCIAVQPILSASSNQITDCRTNMSKCNDGPTRSSTITNITTTSTSNFATPTTTATMTTTTTTTITTITTTTNNNNNATITRNTSSTSKSGSALTDSDTNEQASEGSSVPRGHWLLWAFAAAVGGCVVTVSVLVYIILKRKCYQDERRPGKDTASYIGYCNRFGRICCCKLNLVQYPDGRGDSTPSIYGEIPSLREQNNLEMRTVNRMRPSDVESQINCTFGHYSAPSRGENLTHFQGAVNSSNQQAAADELSLLSPAESHDQHSRVADAEGVARAQKCKLLDAVKLLASLRGNEGISWAQEQTTSQAKRSTNQRNTFLYGKIYSEEDEEKLNEAIRLINEFIRAGGNSTELVEFASRPPSIAESLAEHSYEYPRLTIEVIEQILADSKKRQKKKRRRR